jgi:hypothetical protein
LGHPWSEWHGDIKLPLRLSFYEYRIEQEPYTEDLPPEGYEQGYRLPHPYDRGFVVDQHGNYSTYVQGCRCTKCRMAQSEYGRARRDS